MLAAILRFATLAVQSFWGDEALPVLRLLRPSFRDVLHAIADSESGEKASRKLRIRLRR